MTARHLDVIVPGPLAQRTGGYLYDARIVSELRERGWTVRVHELDGRFPDADERGRAALAGALERVPDEGLVVIDGLAMGSLPEPVRAASGRLVVVSLVHHPLADERGLDPVLRDRLRALEAEAVGASAGVIVTSRFTARRLSSYGVGMDDVHAVLPGVDRAPLASGPGAGAPPRLICVASVTPRKGQDVLVRALGRLRDEAWTCVCAGSLVRDAAYAETVQALVRTLDLGDRVEFTGEVDEAGLEGIYATGSLLVLPSYFEGYGMVLVEALARGLPVVSTTGGAIPSTVPGDCGLLVAPGDDAGLARAMATMLEPGRMASYQTAVRRRARELRPWSETARAFETALDAIRGHAGPHRRTIRDD